MQSRPREPSPSQPSRHDAPQASEDVRWCFGGFTVWETQRRIEHRDRALQLGARSFDLLLQLLKRAGELVSKDELLASVWTGVVVEEASVRVHMSLLRKALGAPAEGDGCREWIATIPQRGYRFNGRVVCTSSDDSLIAGTSPATTFTKPPVPLTELVGREDDITLLLDSVDKNRLVTLVGPGGIGKTSAATSAVGRHQQSLAAEVAFVDFAPLISADHVVGAMARSLGIAADLPDPIEAIAQRLRNVDVLLLIDNCEHVLDALAGPISRLLAALPRLRILATSREPLRIPGEHVLRLLPLAVPETTNITTDEALRWSSVRLLVDRARDAGGGVFNPSDGPLLAQLAQQLDGMPLAIELVAAQLGVQSVGDLARRLNERLLLLGSRTGFDRHKSLAAALDWSIALLGDEELRTFRRLSLFRGRFDVESAIAVAASDMDPDTAFDALISLANKSLVSFDSHDTSAPYRLLDTTRAYAAELVTDSNERPQMLRRHAARMLDLMKAATAELPSLTAHAWGEKYAHYLNDVRAALDASVTELVDAKISAALVTASAPLWFHVSQVAEYRDRVMVALDLVDRQPKQDVETATWLVTALVIALLHTGVLHPSLARACERALADALAVKSRVLELQARWGSCVHDIFRGEYSAALRQSGTLLELARTWGDPAALNLALRTSAMANHFGGSFDTAARQCDESLRISRDLNRTRTNMVGVEPNVAAMALQSRTLWIIGESSRALETAYEAVRRAESSGHTVSLCAALYGACPVALWSGEVELATRWIRLMMEASRRQGLIGWLRYAQWCQQGLELSVTESPEAHIREISNQFATYDAPQREMLVTFCSDWVDDGMVARIDSGEGLWSAAEVWRAIGQHHERRGMTNEAAHYYRRALDTAKQQGARGWAQRAALSLARLWHGLGRPQEAMDVLDDGFGLSHAPVVGNPAIAQAVALRSELTKVLKRAGRTTRLPRSPRD